MTFIVAPMAPLYIKKEDARDYLSTIHRHTGIIAAIYGIISIVLRLTLVSAISNKGVVIQNHGEEIAVWGCSLLLFFIAGKLFLEKPDFASMNNRIRSYKSSDMVKTEQVTGKYYQNIILFLFLLVSIALIATIVPIYLTIYSLK